MNGCMREMKAEMGNGGVRLKMNGWYGLGSGSSVCR